MSDGTAAPVAQSFQIVVADVNDPPVFTSTAPTAATQGVLYTYTATATDPDGNTLTFAAPTLPAWLTFSGATLSGTPAQANVGTHSVTITVSDGTAAPVAQSFQIVVADANDPPVFTSTAPTAATQGVLYTYTATATDPDPGSTLTFAAPTRPAVAHPVRCDARGHSGSSQRRHAQRHDHGVGWHRPSGRADRSKSSSQT